MVVSVKKLTYIKCECGNKKSLLLDDADVEFHHITCNYCPKCKNKKKPDHYEELYVDEKGKPVSF